MDGRHLRPRCDRRDENDSGSSQQRIFHSARLLTLAQDFKWDKADIDPALAWTAQHAEILGEQDDIEEILPIFRILKEQGLEFRECRCVACSIDVTGN